MKIPRKIAGRQAEIIQEYYAVIDRHIADIMEGRADKMYHIKDVAAVMHIHPTHLSNTIKAVTGNPPCAYFEDKLMEVARQMLQDPGRTIADVATSLTFDTSNFTKFFKRFQGVTPSVYRAGLAVHAAGVPA